MTTEQAYQLALQRQQFGDRAGAESLFRQILVNQSNHPPSMQALAYLLHQTGRNAEAIQWMRRAVDVMPGSATYHGNLGVILASEKRWDEAIAAYHRSIALEPNQALVHNDLGNALIEKGMIAEAIAEFERAIALAPNVPGIYSNLGKAYLEKGRPDDAIDACRTALSLCPEFVEAMNNLGTALQAVGDLDGAIESFRKGATKEPDAPIAQNLLYAIHFHPGFDAQRIWQEHSQWNQRRSPVQTATIDRVRDRNPERRLRIGYVSCDFRQHPVGRFLLPLLANHDHRDFEIYCYSDVARPDALTSRLHACADEWRSTIALSNEALARSVAEDKIDILVDLAMHTHGSRLQVFARKPAAVQVTYLAYCSTTGLDTIDYRLTDPYLDPPENEDEYYSEKSVRLPHSYWCYQAPEQAPEVSPLPARVSGQITFGCLNNFAKTTLPTLQVWAQLLRKLPRSKVLLHAHEGKHRDRVRRFFEDEKVDPTRIEFVGYQQPRQYLSEYQRIDIALDPFPYAGGTTTCDALWMGVPVVSLAGKTAVSRAGLSILSNVGLPELVAGSEQEYIKIVTEMAADLSRLEALRQSLRPRMAASPLMDAPNFAREVESAFRQMWRVWCGSRT